MILTLILALREDHQKTRYRVNWSIAVTACLGDILVPHCENTGGDPGSGNTFAAVPGATTHNIAASWIICEKLSVQML